MSPFCCPCCTSSNVAVGISSHSNNVVQFCNDCNFRDVIFYADSGKQAESYCKRLYRFFARIPVKLKRKLGRKMPKLRIQPALLRPNA